MIYSRSALCYVDNKKSKKFSNKKFEVDSFIDRGNIKKQFHAKLKGFSVVKGKSNKFFNKNISFGRKRSINRRRIPANKLLKSSTPIRSNKSRKKKNFFRFNSKVSGTNIGKYSKSLNKGGLKRLNTFVKESMSRIRSSYNITDFKDSLTMGSFVRGTGKSLSGVVSKVSSSQVIGDEAAFHSRLGDFLSPCKKPV